MVKQKTKPVPGDQDQLDTVKDLILYNDDKNTFDFVIEALIEVCEHDIYQAETCTLIAHHRGKCPVRSGAFIELKPMFDEMGRRGLTVEIT
ncbi:MAG: ATP-dependent Clp protease adaptor ClpS [Bacteroidetes bacterium]|nr:ATP-dependent Clp protease adaptor ClpS [Bacteroidota bacterium]